MSLTAACAKIELILSDVDGVMTDGGIWHSDDGRQLVKFHIRDGMGIRLWREAGKLFGIITGRNLEAVRQRAADLKLDVLRQGVDDKLPVVDAIADELGLAREAICYVGDDLLDLPTIRAVGLVRSTPIQRSGRSPLCGGAPPRPAPLLTTRQKP